MKLLHPSKINIIPEIREKKIQSIYFTSPQSGSGTSTCALSFASMLSHMTASNIILIDGNIENQTLTNNLGLQGMKGLTDLLLLPEGSDISEMVFKLKNKLIHLMPCGQASIEYPSTVQFANLMNRLKTVYQYIILDAPSVFSDGSMLNLGAHFDSSVLVVGSGESRPEIIHAAKNYLQEIGLDLSGVMLNKRKYPVPGNIYNLMT